MPYAYAQLMLRNAKAVKDLPRYMFFVAGLSHPVRLQQKLVDAKGRLPLRTPEDLSRVLTGICCTA